MTKRKQTVSRRKVLRAAASAGGIGAAGLLGVGTTATATAQAQQQRPTVAVSSPKCETLRWEYLDTGTGPLTVDILVDGEHVGRVDRGRFQYHHAEPGEHVVEARPAGSSGTDSIVVEGSPVEVEACPPPGVAAWVDCSADRPLRLRNERDELVWIRWRRKYVPDGWWVSGWFDIPPGETVTRSITVTTGGSSSHTYHWSFQAKTEQDPGGGDILVPINGSTAPLVIDQPCNELDLPTEPP